MVAETEMDKIVYRFGNLASWPKSTASSGSPNPVRGKGGSVVRGLGLEDLSSTLHRPHASLQRRLR